MPAQGLPGATVELVGDPVKLILRDAGQALTFRKVLAEETVGVLVAAALPWTPRVAEIDREAGVDGEAEVACHLRALVPGQRTPQAGGKPHHGFSERLADSFGGEWTAKDFDKNTGVRSYPFGKVLKAWMPFGILSVVVLVWGLPRVKLMLNQVTPAFRVVQADGKVRPGPPGWDVPYLHNAVYRASPVVDKPAPEAARYDFNWL